MILKNCIQCCASNFSEPINSTNTGKKHRSPGVYFNTKRKELSLLLVDPIYTLHDYMDTIQRRSRVILHPLSKFWLYPNRSCVYISPSHTWHRNIKNQQIDDGVSTTSQLGFHRSAQTGAPITVAGTKWIL